MSTTPVACLDEARLKAEMARCEFCEEKPCREACPAHCSPADFIRAASGGDRSDVRRAAAIILGSNPLGGVCGAVCPDRHCVAACSRKGFDRPIDIPAVQAAIVQRAKDLGVMPAFPAVPGVAKGARRVAIVGAGPAGLGAAAVLAREGVRVDVYDARREAGGMCLDIPDDRLDKAVLRTDVEWMLAQGPVTLHLGRKVRDPGNLRAKSDAVLVATGLDTTLRLGIPGEKAAIDWRTWLESEAPADVAGKRVAVIGGGAVAVDCAEIAVGRGAASVELFALEAWAEMPLTNKERHSLRRAGVQVTGRTRVTRIVRKGGAVAAIKTVRVALPPGVAFHPRNVVEVPGTAQARPDVDVVIVAIGARPSAAATDGVVIVGDAANGPTTVVEAVAAGKNAAAALLASWAGLPAPSIARATKSRVGLKGRDVLPVPLDCDFFGTPIRSPFLLSAAPPTDGYDQMVKAYEAGWAGGVMKTAFDGVPIHIPSAYMFAFGPTTYANCDNVSGHPLSRVCREIERLRREWPDRLTLGSTGGPVTGDDAHDARGWQSNTRLLESAGACGIEYSLSCPQGGDGTKGDIVSQDAELTARIIAWVLEAGDPNVPKLFKLTGAVTSIHPILAAIREVFGRYPAAKAGVTLANTFPTLAFRPGAKATWDEGVVVGMSGEGVTPISNLTLANAARHGLVVSGNGGPMNARAAADFLALGARTVQFCTVAMKHGVGIVDDLHGGLSYWMAERGILSVKDLIGRALPDPITGFMDLSPVKRISAVRGEACRHCGNCTRCPYLAVTLDGDKVPSTDPSRCVGCSICVQKCFSGALYMRDRTPAEAAALKED